MLGRAAKASTTLPIRLDRAAPLWAIEIGAISRTRINLGRKVGPRGMKIGSDVTRLGLWPRFFVILLPFGTRFLFRRDPVFDGVGPLIIIRRARKGGRRRRSRQKEGKKNFTHTRLHLSAGTLRLPP